MKTDLYAVPIVEEYFPLLALLNGGMIPAIEAEPTFLIVNPSGINAILTAAQLERMFLPDTNGIVSIYKIVPLS